MKITPVIFGCIVVILAFACQNRAKKDDMLFAGVERQLKQQPDSALALLHTITDPEALGPEAFNKYLLLEIQAKDKSNNDITADTLIFGAKDYYLKRREFLPAATAAFYCGRVRYKQGLMEEATRAYLEAEHLAAKTNAPNIKGLIQGNLCTVCLEQDLLDEAMMRGKNAMVWFNAAENHKNEIKAMLRVGNCFLYHGEADSTLYYCREGMALADRYQIPELQVITRQNIAVTLLERGNHALAKLFLQEALALSKEDDTSRAKIFLSMAKVFHAEQQADSALYYIGQSQASGGGDPYFLASLWELQALIEEDAGLWPQALESYSKYMDYVFETFDDDRSAALLDIQKKYDYERLKSEAGRKVIRTQYTAILLLCLLVSALVVTSYLFRRAAHSHRKVLKAEETVNSLMAINKNLASNDKIRYQFDILKDMILLEESLSQEKREKEEWLFQKVYKIMLGKDLSKKERLYQTLNKLQYGLYDKLRERYPSLTEEELYICCFACVEGMRNMDISVILNISSVNMVQKKRSEIRKKTGMSSRGNFRNFFDKHLSKRITE